MFLLEKIHNEHFPYCKKYICHEYKSRFKGNRLEVISYKIREHLMRLSVCITYLITGLFI